ncbi:hypothetical protein ACFX13_008107 [Malus domestica]
MAAGVQRAMPQLQHPQGRTSAATPPPQQLFHQASSPPSNHRQIFNSLLVEVLSSESVRGLMSWAWVLSPVTPTNSKRGSNSSRSSSTRWHENDNLKWLYLPCSAHRPRLPQAGYYQPNTTHHDVDQGRRRFGSYSLQGPHTLHGEILDDQAVLEDGVHGFSTKPA